MQRLPHELVLEVASHLALADTNSLLRTARRFALLLSPALVKRAATPQVCDSDSGRSLLHWATVNKRKGLMAQLLLEQADPNTADHQGSTALHSAVLQTDAEAVEMLLRGGADPEIANDLGWRPLHVAAVTGSGRMAALLLQHGANAAAWSEGVFPATPLHYAVWLQHHAVADILVQYGADEESLPGQWLVRWMESEVARGNLKDTFVAESRSRKFCCRSTDH